MTYNRRLSTIECNSCSTPNDGYFELSHNEALAATLQNPQSQREVQTFWLCTECTPEYSGGPKEFFGEEFWEDLPVCASCSIDGVENWGHWCDYCDSLNEDNEQAKQNAEGWALLS